MTDYRVGLGVDAHALEEGVVLVLGGVRFDHPRGLAGHSDGDVIAHALVDALLAAVNGGDIGTLFPSDDPRLEGIDSLEMLAEAYRRVQAEGYELVNGACVLWARSRASPTGATRWPPRSPARSASMPG